MNAADDDGPVEKSYRVVGNTGRWAIAEDSAEPAGDYATREGAFEAIYLAVYGSDLWMCHEAGLIAPELCSCLTGR